MSELNVRTRTFVRTFLLNDSSVAPTLRSNVTSDDPRSEIDDEALPSFVVVARSASAGSGRRAHLPHRDADARTGRAGLDPKAAREIVLSRIGDLGQLKRTCEDLGRKREREMRLTQWLEELRDDVTYAFRQMKASPGFTAVAAITLALGIGANSAMFALADATFLRPLPFGEPTDRLVMLWERRANGFTSMASPLEFREWNQPSRNFESMATFASGSRTISGVDGTPEQVAGQTVSAKFFDVLGVAPHRRAHVYGCGRHRHTDAGRDQ